MTAEIVAIGTEILLGDIADTNSQRLGRLLARYGFDHHRRTTVGDNLERASSAIREALGRADVVFTIGGLGPTTDDLTREAIAEALNDQILHDIELEQRLREKLAARKRPWVSAAAKMADRPSCAIALDNPAGTAPGLLCTKNGKTVIALPGPKAEFQSVLDGSVQKWLEERSTGVLISRTVRIVGLVEASVQERLAHLFEGRNPAVAPYVKLGEVHVRVAAKAASEEEAAALIEPVVEEIKDLLGSYVYSDEDEPLEAVVLEMLRLRRQTLATAESCTGGVLAERITSIPGSSDAYVGGFVTYSNEMKARELGVARSDLNAYGAVSEPVARQMAEGARRVTGADFALAITGIAGPGGGTAEKPVGLVFIALSGPRGTEVREERFLGDREAIRARAAQVALVMIRAELMRE